MKTSDLLFERPADLQATSPPEVRGRGREDVRLLVSTPQGHTHARFADLPRFLAKGDLIVVNDSATIGASMHASGDAGGDVGRFLMNVSTRYAAKLWLVEPRWATDRPGPLPMHPGDHVRVCDQDVRFVAPYPAVERLWFVEGDLAGAMMRCGEPIRYGYVDRAQPLSAYQSMFARAPGSAEMPSAARPFTPAIVEALQRQGVGIASIRLHTGVSSIEVDEENVEDHPIPAEPYRVSAGTAGAVNAAREEGRRVIAIGTTVVRALESAWRDGAVRPSQGFTRVVIHPDRGVNVVDGLLTGFHDPGASHLGMLYAVAGKDLVRDGYEQAVRGRYLWHEFGDSHLLLPG